MSDQLRQNRDDVEAKRLISRLENQLQNIEAGEIVNNRTREELEEMGFIGDKEIEIKRAIHRETTEKEKLCFAADVDYKRLGASIKFETLVPQSFDDIRDVKTGELIATRAINETLPFGAGTHVNKQAKNEIDHYYADVNGKVLIIHDKLYVLPSEVDSTMEVEISKDRMTATLTCTPSYGAGRPLILEAVYAALEKSGVRFGLQRSKIEQTVAMSNQSRRRQEKVPIATGLLPVTGKDGEPECRFDENGGKQEFKILPDGRIDYKNSTNILMASRGDLLAVVKDPGKGTSGVDVTGGVAPANDGRPCMLTAGRGVRQTPDGRCFYADVSGHIVCNGNLLEILEIFVINSDVDYSTGNVNFNGNVLVTGDVKEGFEIKATGDIIVLQNVESSRIEAGRDIRITGGIMSKGKGLVSAGRDITVDYVQNARLEAQGSITIDNFAVNSYLFTSRYLKMQSKRGTVLGGEIYAQMGIDVKVLGSENGKKTFVEAGTDYLVQKKIIELEDALKFVENNIIKIDSALRPVLELIKTQPNALDGKREVIRKTLEKKKEYELQKKTMIAKDDELKMRLTEKEACFVKVSGICYSDVQIKIKENKILVPRPVEHKTFYEDRNEGEIRMSAYA